ncbi:MAG TPA: ABC transporter substrate-binding protein [Opitutaceae bacterium]|nr:ABC transporter substrate-binding protein [Opitutaceae bacterium]
MIFSRLATVWMLLALALGPGCARRENSPAAPTKADAPLRKIVFQTDWLPEAEHGGFYQALAKGFYREAGLEVEILPGGPGATIKSSVATGRADFGMNRSDDVIMAASQGLPLVMVGAVLLHDPEALLVHEASPVKSVRDLAGRTVIAPPSMTWIPYVQKKYGIAFDLKRTAYGLTAFFADENAIQQCIVTSEPYFAAQHGVRVRTVSLTDEDYDPYHTIICRRELARTEPDLVRAFVAASVRGWRDYLTGDPAAANALIRARNREMSEGQLAFSRAALIERKFVLGDAARGESAGAISLERLQRQIDVLTNLKILGQPVSVASVLAQPTSPTGGTP